MARIGFDPQRYRQEHLEDDIRDDVIRQLDGQGQSLEDRVNNITSSAAEAMRVIGQSNEEIGRQLADAAVQAKIRKEAEQEFFDQVDELTKLGLGTVKLQISVGEKSSSINEFLDSITAPIKALNKSDMSVAGERLAISAVIDLIRHGQYRAMLMQETNKPKDHESITALHEGLAAVTETKAEAPRTPSHFITIQEAVEILKHSTDVKQLVKEKLEKLNGRIHTNNFAVVQEQLAKLFDLSEVNFQPA
jgi:hypothetical protein